MATGSHLSTPRCGPGQNLDSGEQLSALRAPTTPIEATHAHWRPSRGTQANYCDRIGDADAKPRRRRVIPVRDPVAQGWLARDWGKGRRGMDKERRREALYPGGLGVAPGSEQLWRRKPRRDPRDAVEDESDPLGPPNSDVRRQLRGRPLLSAARRTHNVKRLTSWLRLSGACAREREHGPCRGHSVWAELLVYDLGELPFHFYFFSFLFFVLNSKFPNSNPW
jgi:hypothetical protein